jgi:hypothetical protein
MATTSIENTDPLFHPHTPHTPKNIDNKKRHFSEVSADSPIDSKTKPIGESKMKELLDAALEKALKPIHDQLTQLQHSKDEREDEAEYFHSTLASLSHKNDNLDGKVTKLEEENASMRSKINSLEAHSRRSNLKFYGFDENRFENAEQLVLDFLRSTGFDLGEMAVERAHRLGPYVPGKSRPVIVKFWHFKERERIWKILAGGTNRYYHSKISIAEDFPDAIESARKRLLPIFHAAKHYRDPVTKNPVKVRLNVDRLYINNQRYTVDTLHLLPQALQPAAIYTPSNW